MESCILGIDFDNTVVTYDEVLHKTALEWGFIDATIAKDKKSIRDEIRLLPAGERKWRQLQAHVYGKAMDKAKLIDGVREFFNSCRQYKVPTYIVSHKTEFAAEDTDNTNLRDTALDWMKKNKFFDEDGLGISEDRVYFETSRLEKIERIKKLGCTHFIDDLEETFGEENFPDIHKILYASKIDDYSPPGLTVLSTWEKIYDYFFGEESHSLARQSEAGRAGSYDPTARVGSGQ